MWHRSQRVQESLVHVDINYLSAALNLIPRNFEGGFIVIIFDEPSEATRPCDVGPLSHINE